MSSPDSEWFGDMNRAHDAVNQNADAQFFADHPELDPSMRLDPHDPSQKELINEWNADQRGQANDATDMELKARDFAAGGSHIKDDVHLDPKNPEHAVAIEHWNDIHEQIVHGAHPTHAFHNPDIGAGETAPEEWQIPDSAAQPMDDGG